jgi:prepilin-type N-terminal cleavage/methylation domain-containing protein
LGDTCPGRLCFLQTFDNLVDVLIAEHRSAAVYMVPETLSSKTPARSPRAFTLLELLVSIFIMAVLLGILLPTLMTVNEGGRRVVCRSNVRQHGLGISMYAEDNREFIPSSQFAVADAQGRNTDQSKEMMILRLPGRAAPFSPAVWDGLGRLHEGGYVLGPKIYYCPSHNGTYHWRNYAASWSDGDSSLLVGNYHYRGAGANRERRLFMIEPARSALVADGLRSLASFSHKVGSNVLCADLSSRWVPDESNAIYALLSQPDDDIGSDDVDSVWRILDSGVDSGR